MTPFHFGDPPTAQPNERRIEVPAHLATKTELLDFLAKAFPLPPYFGHNWDALEECLLDLDWMKEPKVVLIHHDIPLAATPTDQKVYLCILAQAAKNSIQLGVAFPTAAYGPIKKLLAKLARNIG